MKVFQKILSLFFCVMAFSIFAIELRTGVDKVQFLSSEQLTFWIELEAPKTVNVDLPEIGDQIDGLKVVDFGQDPEK